jgi:hypothetical protein
MQQRLSYSNFKRLFAFAEKIQKKNSEASAHILKLFDGAHPYGILYFDQLYSEMLDVIFCLLEGRESKEGISWFVYEWRPGLEIGIQEEGKEYKINNIRDYYNYVYRQEN